MAPPCPLPALYCHLPPCVDNSEFSVAIPITAFLLSVFPMYHIRMKNGLPRTFSSRSITSGNPRHAFQAPLWHFPVFLMYHIRDCLNTFLCSQGSCSKSFWDLPLVEGHGRHIHPKTTTFCLVLGFTPSRQPSRAHQSQNDLGQLYSGSSVTLPSGLCGTFRSFFSFPFFPDV